MKSAYELAMERLAKSDPASAPLTAKQKARLAEIDALYKSKIAEREIFLKQQLEAAFATGKREEIEQVKKQMTNERRRLEEERDEEKDRARSGGKR